MDEMNAGGMETPNTEERATGSNPNVNPRHVGTDPDNPDFNESAEGEGERERKPPEEVPEWKKAKHKVKIDDSEMEVDYDELTRGYQRMQAAQKRFEEASKLRKEAEQAIEQVKAFQKQLQQSPDKFLPKILGKDMFQKIAEDYVWSQIQHEKQYENVPPEIRQRLQQAEEWEQKAREWEAEQQRRQEEQRTAAERREIEQRKAKWEQQITQGLEQYGADLPKNADTLRRAAFYVQAALSNNAPVDMQDIAEQVRESYRDELRRIAGNATPEQLLQIFGEDVANKIRKYDIARVKSPTPQRQSVSQESANSGRNKRKQYRTWEETFGVR